jgi:hypothetical protein
MDEVIPFQKMTMFGLPPHCQQCQEERLIEVEELPEGRKGVFCQVCGSVSLLDKTNSPIRA